MVVPQLLSIHPGASDKVIRFLPSCSFFARRASRKCLGTQKPAIKSKRRHTNFHFLLDRIWKRLSGWKEKLLSVATKEVLIKSVIQAILTYIMQCFLLPKGVRDQILHLILDFWWGRENKQKRRCWRSWEEIYCPKNEDGLGFHNSHHFNQALLAKQS